MSVELSSQKQQQRTPLPPIPCIAQIQKEVISNLKPENQFLLKEIWSLYEISR
jgi:hypothetical protein